ncbi:hypothetical protein [Salinisphaera sp. T31B1]|uniref:hypothetical protein n=1 Tax=Salinisphaera sp. T31B1 TaxID=727963 RepID=UPI0033410B1F
MNSHIRRLPQTDGCGGLWHLTLDNAIDLPDLILASTLHHVGPHSRVYRHAGPPALLIKLAVPRSRPRDSVRKYFLGQGRREYDSACKLRAAGLRAPQVYGWGISLSPVARFESLLVMEWIRPFNSALTFIRHEADRDRRLAFLYCFADEIARLHGHGLIHKDGHFGNFGLYDDRSLIWIDNDIRATDGPPTLKAGFVKMLDLLVRTARGAIEADEWRAFYDRLAQALAKWPKARILIDEIQRRG